MPGRQSSHCKKTAYDISSHSIDATHYNNKPTVSEQPGRTEGG